jgi:pyruvate/2-oxoglutarate dehydrogenase complex dihydrolipoamide dehydrogenase (E3) component
VTVVEFLDRIIPGTDAEIAKKFMTVRSSFELEAWHCVLGVAF